MTLPITLTDLGYARGPCGPYKSSGGNYYVIGRDSSTATTLNALKASNPASSWSSISTKTGFSTAIEGVSAYKVGDVIHLMIVDGASSSARNIKYVQFDMATDTFGTVETPVASVNVSGSYTPQTQKFGITVRSNGNAVLCFNGASVSNMGTSYTRVYYVVRTGTNTYGTVTLIDAGGTSHYQAVGASLGASDTVYLYHSVLFVDTLITRTLSSAGSLGTANTNTDVLAVCAVNGAYSTMFPQAAIAYDNGGTQKICYFGNAPSNGPLRAQYNDSGGTLNTGTSAADLTGITGNMAVVDGTDIWVIAGDNATGVSYQLNIAKSTDSGSTWTTVASDIVTEITQFNSFGRCGTTLSYTNVAGDTVFPYVYCDGAVWRYNEYVITSGSVDQNLTAGLVASDDTFYAPTGVRDGAVDPGFIASDDQIYAPIVSQPTNDLSGFATTLSPVGYFMSSAKNFYVFGKDASTGTTLAVRKAGGTPTNGFSALTTKTGFSTAILDIAGYQVGDVIHLAVADGSSSSYNCKYVTFDMSTDSFVLSETVNSGANVAGLTATHWGVSIAVRSGGEVVCIFNSERELVGSYVARLQIKRRTGVDTWSTAINVGATGNALEDYDPDLILGDSDRVAILFQHSYISGPAQTNSAFMMLTAANTVTDYIGNPPNPYTSTLDLPEYYGTPFKAHGVTHVFAISALDQTTTASDTFALPMNSDSANADNYNADAPGSKPTRVWSDNNGKIYVIYRDATNGHLRYCESNDQGVNFINDVDLLASNVALDSQALSVDASFYDVENFWCLGFIYNDNGSHKVHHKHIYPSNIIPGLVGADDAFYVPTVQNQNQPVTAGLVASDDTVYAPTRTSTNAITAGLVASDDTLYAPARTSTNSATAGLVASDDSILVPAVTRSDWNVTPGLFASDDVIYTATIGEVTAGDLAVKHFRFRTDAGGVDATPTWGAAEDSSDYYPGTNTFRLRAAIKNERLSDTGALPFQIYLSKNGGTRVAITTTSTDGVKSADAGSDADDTALTVQRLTTP